MEKNQDGKNQVYVKTIIDMVMEEAEVEIRRLQKIEQRLISRREELQNAQLIGGEGEKKRAFSSAALSLAWLQGQMYIIRLALDNTESEGGE